MSLSPPGTDTFAPAVTHISQFGIWLLVHEAEYYLPYAEYPWFREARVAEILDVRLLTADHLHWPALDVDLSVESLQQPAGFPLTYV